MYLPSISFVDIVVFLVALTLRIIFSSNLLLAISTVLRAIPFLLYQLPLELIRERCLHPGDQYHDASLFQAVVLKCMRYSFVNLPIPVARCFFDKAVVLPFYYWRVLRSGKLWAQERPTWKVVNTVCISTAKSSDISTLSVDTKR